MTALLQARGLVRCYEGQKSLFHKAASVRAVDGVDLTLKAGETLGIVGESGSGKSTLGRMLLGIDAPTEGQVLFDGQPMPPLHTAPWRALRAQMQFVYQDPLAALDRRLTIARQIGEPLEIHGLATGVELTERVAELMAQVGLRQDQGARYPHELSGGQRQRVIIARALATSPRIVEEASSDQIFAQPEHPYTQALVSSVPVPGKRLQGRILLKGEPPNPAQRPAGCAFHPRCAAAVPSCAQAVPSLQTIAPARRAACHLLDAPRAGRAA